jgi:hypothetical protein
MQVRPSAKVQRTGRHRDTAAPDQLADPAQARLVELEQKRFGSDFQRDRLGTDR